MSIDVRRVTDAAEWNRCVERSPGAGVFHRAEALRVQAEHSNSTVHPLVGYKGQEPAGLLPLFELRKGPFVGVFSPPPYLWVPSLGPALLNVDKLKQRKRERRHEAFITGCLDWLDEHLSARYVRLTTGVRYDDIRPLFWHGYDLSLAHSYVVDLSPGPDALFDRFSSSVRRSVRDAEGTAHTIEEGGRETVERIVSQTRARYETQDKPFSMPTAFATDLHDRLPEVVRPYALSLDGEFVGGVLALDDGETVTWWHGGVRPAVETDLAVNDLLNWRIIRDATERGRGAYDLIGADEPRINRYKTKFAPDLRTRFTAESASTPIRSLLELYRALDGAWA